MPLDVFDPEGRSDKMRWRYGDTNPVMATVAEAVAVRMGDLLWQDVEDVQPASELALRMGEPYTREELQAVFASLFLGVALQRSQIGETNAIRVATGGVFEFDISPTRCQIGQLVGAAPSPDGTVLRDQRVQLVGRTARAFGRVERTERDASPRLLVRIFSQVMAPLIPEV